MCLTPSAHTKFIKKNQPRNEMHCTGFFPVKTVKHGLNLNCRRNKKERERGRPRGRAELQAHFKWESGLQGTSTCM